MKYWLQGPQTYKRNLNWFDIAINSFCWEKFTQMKLIKTHLRNSLTEGRLTQLIRIAIESTDELTEDEIEVILEIWIRKPRRISIWTSLL